MRLACTLSVGKAREIYLAAMLESIAPVVDLLVVNDNSGQEASENRRVLESSAFGQNGRLRIFRHRFDGFDTMRNDAFAPLLELESPPEWVAFIDADEVHGEQVAHIKNAILPQLDPAVAHVDGFTYHFFGTFSWLTDIARRFSFYRFSRKLRWVNRVHEKLTGLEGRALVLPYIYHHYGNVLPPASFAAKDLLSYELGNPVRVRPPSPEAADITVYRAKAGQVRPFTGRHPAVAVPLLATIAAANAATFSAIEAAFSTDRSFMDRLKNGARGCNERLRVALRRVQCGGLWTGDSEAR